MPIRTWKDIHGYFSYDGFYGAILNWLKPNDIFVEVGSWMGRSIGYAATKVKNEKKRIRLISIDHGVLDIHLKGKKPWGHLTTTTGHFVENMRACRVLPYITHIVGDSAKSAELFADESIKFCFIDACHTYEAVKRDVAAWIPKIKPGGILAGHDYKHKGKHVGVERAVDERFKFSCPVTSHSGNCWAVVLTPVEKQWRPLNSCPNYLNGGTCS